MPVALGETSCYGKGMSGWPNLSDLIIAADAEAPVGLVGAPLGVGSVTPGSCDQAPALLRKTLRRIGRYDIESGREIAARIADHGDVAVAGMSIEQATGPIRSAVETSTTRRDLTLLIGGNNAVTRPGVLGLGMPLERVGLITLDAHFDMRETDQGPMNGNPVRCLLEDGLPGRNLVQIGLAPFANTAKMHLDAQAAGAATFNISQCLEQGIVPVLDLALERLAHVEAIIVDFDIDVIDRAQCPGAPGARPGGMPAQMFFDAARRLAAEPRVKLVDLTEFDPSLDVGDTTALTAGRWVCEVMAGFAVRG